MVYILYKIIFIVVTVMIFQHQTFAPWREQPVRPPNDEVHNCEGWIKYHGFKDYPHDNRELAIQRERIYDPDVSLWAAGYASVLLSDFESLKRNISVWEYCLLSKSTTEIILPYVTLSEAKESCKFWIRLFGYEKASILYRQKSFSNRNTDEDKYISIWALFYIQFVLATRENATTDSEKFCKDIGKNTESDADRMPFMSIDATRLSCQEWIELAGFSDDINNNYHIISTLHPKYHDIIFHSWTQQYITAMLDSEHPYTFKSLALRKTKPLKPKKFCEQILCPMNHKREFFNNVFTVNDQ